MTIKEEKKSLDHLDLVWIGPITNVAHSWIEAYNKKLGFSLTICCPESLQRKYEEKCKLHNINFNKSKEKRPRDQKIRNVLLKYL